jgi:membrane protease YdiL (CAAX protease family)
MFPFRAGVCKDGLPRLRVYGKGVKMIGARGRGIPDWAVLVGYFAGVLVLGALLAPPVVSFGQWIVVTFKDSPLLGNAILADAYGSVVRAPFTRFFDRAILVAALLLLVPAFLLLRRRGRVRMGLERNPAFLWHYVFGFTIAAGGLLALGYGLKAAGMFLPDADFEGFASVWMSIMATAVVVALLEEFLFRGGMLALLLRSMRPVMAVLLVSGLFAIVHFLEAPKKFSIEREDVVWSSGFFLLGKMLAHLGDVRVVVAELFVRFFVGVVLASVRLRSRSLWLPMGLHAGWVFGVQMFSETTDPSDRLRAGELLPWVGGNLKTGIVPLVVVGLTWWVVMRVLRRAGRNG